jgi:hypothetical protein
LRAIRSRTNTNAYSNSEPDSNRNVDSCSNSDSYADGYAYSDANRDNNCDGDSYSNGNGNSNTYPDSNADTYTDADPMRWEMFTDAEAAPNAGATTYATASPHTAACRLAASYSAAAPVAFVNETKRTAQSAFSNRSASIAFLATRLTRTTACSMVSVAPQYKFFPGEKIFGRTARKNYLCQQLHPRELR